MDKLEDKYLNKEGVEALRTFAESMPLAIDNISEATEKLYKQFESVAEGLGIKQDAFKEILEYVKSAQEKATEALEYLPAELEQTATAIEEYIVMSVGVSSGN